MQLAQGATGMQTMTKALMALLEDGAITREEALARATEPDEVRRQLDGTAAIPPGR